VDRQAPRGQDAGHDRRGLGLHLKEDRFTRGRSQAELRDAARTLASLLSKLRKAKANLAPGSAQASLAANRIKALRVALELIKAKTGPVHAQRKKR
jgi:hypothetical protein